MFWSNLKLLFGFTSSIPVAECMQCHNVSSPRQRECPSCKASFPQNYVIRKITFEDIPEERVEPFISCPSCRRVLVPSSERCPECGATITAAYAGQNIQASVKVAEAYITAQKIESFNPGAFISLAVLVGMVVYEFFQVTPFRWVVLIPFGTSVGALLMIKRWFRWFGSYQSDDEDFVAAQRKVSGALWRWRVVFTLQAGVAAWWLLRWLVLGE